VAQPIIRHFLEDLLEVVEAPDPVVEFGSMQVEANQDIDLRPLFAGRDFTGTDMREGPGVDRVEDLRRLTFADGEVGTAICLDTLEHCADPPQACRELRRVVADDGLCVISSVMLFPVHGYPNDYFRFTPEGFRAMLDGFDDVWVAGIGDPLLPVQVVGVGVNGRTLDLSLDRLPRLAAEQRRWESGDARFRLGSYLFDPGDIARAIVRQAPRVVRDRIKRA
jgi:SAM-dependent methyltransferase